MRTLFGAVVGVLLGVAIIAVLTSQFDVQKSWPVLFAGLVAGIAMRMIASSDHVSYFRGGFAALATVLAMIGGPFVGAKLISQKTLAVAKIEAPASDNVDEEVSSGEGDTLEAVAPPMPLVGTSTSKGVIGVPKQDLNPMEAILMAAGCLIAYQVGKGSEAVVKVTDPDEESPEPADEAAKQESSEEA